MKNKILVFITLFACLTSLAERVETISIDLAKPPQSLTLSITEHTDVSIRAEIKKNNSLVNVSGWEGSLWFGDSSGGVTSISSSAGFGYMTWEIPKEDMPTNGLYRFIILANKNNKNEEWGRGSMAVRSNYASDYIPVSWATNSTIYRLLMTNIADAVKSVVPQSSFIFSNAVSSLVPTNRTITIGSQVGSLQSNLVFASSGGGVTEPTVTNIAEAVSSAYLPISGGTMSGDIDLGENTLIAKRVGELAGLGASGNGWSAIGLNAGYGASGNRWSAIGSDSAQYAFGDEWCSFGFGSGLEAVGNRWVAIGHFSGYKARGDDRVYIDSYSSSPNYQEGGSTNDVFFADAGYLYLGRGNGAPNGAQGGTLRGEWRASSISIGGTNLQDAINQRVATSTLTNYYTKAEIDTAQTAPYREWTGTITPVNGTATVTYAHGNMPRLVLTGPTVLTVDSSGFETSGVSRVLVTLWTGTHILTLDSNTVTYIVAPVVRTNLSTRIMLRRTADELWEGVGL